MRGVPGFGFRLFPAATRVPWALPWTSLEVPETEKPKPGTPRTALPAAPRRRFHKALKASKGFRVLVPSTRPMECVCIQAGGKGVPSTRTNG